METTITKVPRDIYVWIVVGIMTDEAKTAIKTDAYDLAYEYEMFNFACNGGDRIDSASAQPYITTCTFFFG